ncbi:glycosyltransferase family 4 protein [Nucisporomicrobium flavum]|uniref:glycosyltransferase family 4 protein n=1 Tax=Nucisporomicrobium flavum TaxID=2785915 RepID=UPI003C2C75DB
MSGGTRSFEQARRLAARGHEVHIVTSDVVGDDLAKKPKYRWRRTVEAGVNVHWFPVRYSNGMPFSRRLRAFAEFMVVASVRATRLKADLVFATSTPLTVAVPGIVASKLRRIPFVFEVRDLWPEVAIEMGALRNPLARRLAGLLANLAYRNAEEVIVLSPGMADGVVARRPATATTIIPNAADLALFQVNQHAVRQFREGQRWLGDRPLIVYTGTLGIVNGVDYLVRAARRLRELDADVQFLIVGSGQEWEDVRSLAAAQGLLDTTVRMWSSIPKSELPVLLGASTISTSMVRPIPALWDNSANKFFDALAAGRPIAINYGGWQADLLKESGAGLVLDPYDPDAGADSLARGVRDKRWLLDAGRAARGLAIREFSRDLLFERFETVLLRSANRGLADYSATPGLV